METQLSVACEVVVEVHISEFFKFTTLCAFLNFSRTSLLFVSILALPDLAVGKCQALIRPCLKRLLR